MHMGARVCTAFIFRPGQGQRSANEAQPTCVGGWKSNQVTKELKRNVNEMTENSSVFSRLGASAL